ncbi:MAG: orotidine-5'-phosphate decarboxylase [Desulfocucumaceae bacterium]
MAESRNPLIVALDVNDEKTALDLVEALKGSAGMFKVGMELFYSTGGHVVEEIKKRGCSVFLDLKLHDIPNTVARASRVLTRLSPAIINVHASGGPEMMREAAAAVRDEADRLGRERPRVIAVTVLTSINREILNSSIGIAGEVDQCVARWAEMAQGCGLDGVVASPREVKAIRRSCGPGFIIVTPGVRPRGSESGDQKRVMTPAEAISEGATYIVVGRPVIGSDSPSAAAKKILLEMEGRV